MQKPAFGQSGINSIHLSPKTHVNVISILLLHLSSEYFPRDSPPHPPSAVCVLVACPTQRKRSLLGSTILAKLDHLC